MAKKARRRVRKRRVSRQEAMRRESDLDRDAMIRRLLDKPMNRRVWFLRVRHPSGGSHV
jgi:hypothetical protein